MPEDNQNNQNQATPTETVDNQNQSQEAGRTFTQDEVNKIIQARLDRERERATREASAEYEKRLAELTAREMRITAIEELQRRGMSTRYADIITASDKEDLMQKLAALEEITGTATGKEKAEDEEIRRGFLQVGALIDQHAINNKASDPTRAAFFGK